MVHPRRHLVVVGPMPFIAPADGLVVGIVDDERLRGATDDVARHSVFTEPKIGTTALGRLFSPCSMSVNGRCRTVDVASFWFARMSCTTRLSVTHLGSAHCTRPYLCRARVRQTTFPGDRSQRRRLRRRRADSPGQSGAVVPGPPRHEDERWLENRRGDAPAEVGATREATHRRSDRRRRGFSATRAKAYRTIRS